MIPWWALIFLVFGANFMLWGAIGLGRLMDQSVVRRVLPQKPDIYPGERHSGPR